MKIIRQKEAKPDKNFKTPEPREYYRHNDFEFIITYLPPSFTQEWHTHQKITEAIYVISGEIVVKTEKENTETLSEGDLVIFEPKETHTICNNSLNEAKILTLKK